MTDQERSALTPGEQVFADEVHRLGDEITRIANRQMQVVERLDSIQEKISVSFSAHDGFDRRIAALEEWHKKPADLVDKLILPALMVNIALTAGNIAFTFTLAVSFANHLIK